MDEVARLIHRVARQLKFVKCLGRLEVGDTRFQDHCKKCGRKLPNPAATLAAGRQAHGERVVGAQSDPARPNSWIVQSQSQVRTLG